MRALIKQTQNDISGLERNIKPKTTLDKESKVLSIITFRRVSMRFLAGSVHLQLPIVANNESEIERGGNKQEEYNFIKRIVLCKARPVDLLN